MNSFEFWEHMQTYAQMSYLWWYSYLAFPALLLAFGAYLLIAVALRRKQHPPTVFFWLILASLPLLLILPSGYVGLRLGPALSWFGFSMPRTPQEFSLQTARQLGAALDTLALGGIIGFTLMVILLIASAQIGDMPIASPVVQQLSASLTKAVTRAVNPRRGAATLAARYGVLRVTQGTLSGSMFTVRSAVIGKQDADILITDSVVSRRHARLEMNGGAVTLWDEQSTNGTYVQRNGTTFDLNGDSCPLEYGDIIFLGPPNTSTSVCMVYERGEGV